jgi:hypothetical protein
VPGLDELAALITPGSQEVADVIPRRALDADGFGRGDFTTETVPSRDQVLRIAASHALELAAAMPGLPEELYERARQVVAIGTAAAVEASFFPEQQESGATGQLLAIRYSKALSTLRTAPSAAGAGATAAPRGDFPPPPVQTLPGGTALLPLHPWAWGPYA